MFDFEDHEAFGQVLSVDTTNIIVHVADVQKLRMLQVNRLVVIQSSKPGQHLIGIVQKISRTSKDPVEVDVDQEIETRSETNLVRVALIGTYVKKLRGKTDLFLRTLETVPEIDANCFAVEGENLTKFMRVISQIAGDGHKLTLGTYTLDDKAVALLNGNKFFQRHAVVVGSTGSGKSWTTARILEQVADLPQANAVVMDIHGEYAPLSGRGFRHFRVAGPGDLDSGKSLDQNILYLPYWLMGYEALTAMFVDRSDQNAPNQAMVMSRAIIKAKQNILRKNSMLDILSNFTIDSPVPFGISDVIQELESINTEMVPSSRGEKQGEFHGKLSRLIARLDAKRSDRRLGFLFRAPEATETPTWLETLAEALVSGSADQVSTGGGVKIIDFSEVPSDILPLIVSIVARLVFSVQQWTEPTKRHPISIVCDEAHLYMPERADSDSAGYISLEIFERLAKEGRKYGVGLVVVSQRPSEVNRTVLSRP